MSSDSLGELQRRVLQIVRRAREQAVLPEVCFSSIGVGGGGAVSNYHTDLGLIRATLIDPWRGRPTLRINGDNLYAQTTHNGFLVAVTSPLSSSVICRCSNSGWVDVFKDVTELKVLFEYMADETALFRLAGEFPTLVAFDS